MSETLAQSSAEQIGHEVILPQGDALHELYRSKFESIDLPTDRRMVNFGEEDVLGGPNTEMHTLKESYINYATERAYEDSWWVKLSGALERNGVDQNLANNLKIVSKHTLGIAVNGEPTEQNYEVFEVGGEEEDRQAVEMVFDTVQLIDQFSGGLLSADPDRPVLALGNGVELADTLGTEGGKIPAKGLAADQVVFINMPEIKKEAQEAGGSFHELLAAVVAHEVLGHELERRVKGGRGRFNGRYFQEYFDYSAGNVRGELFDKVKETITPKDDAHEGSQPVREYGRANAFEDFATSVDAVVAAAMGWEGTTSRVPRFSSEVDPYRRDLVVQVMEEAAEMARKYDGTPGFVGSELRHTLDDNGNITGTEPMRNMEISSFYGSEIIRQEVQKMVAKYSPGDELKVSPGDAV